MTKTKAANKMIDNGDVPLFFSRIALSIDRWVMAWIRGIKISLRKRRRFDLSKW
jgi:hypothetical protein